MNPENSPALFLGGLVAWFALSIVYRKWNGKHIFATKEPGALFSERWASGRNGSGFIARLSTAKNCLHVQVSAKGLRIGPHFPITLGFVPEVYAMDQWIPIAEIQDVSVLEERRLTAIEVAYRAPGGKTGVLQLLLRNGRAFQEAVHRAKNAA